MNVRYWLRCLLVLLAVCLCSPQVALAGVQVRIDSPASGSFVSAGQVISIVVKVWGLSDEELKRYGVGVIADPGFRRSQDVRVPGGFFSRLVVGSDMASGDYPIVAFVQPLDGESTISAPINVTIPAIPINGIRLRSEVVDLRFVGDSTYVSVIGVDASGRDAYLSEADRQKVKFSVSNAAVASVNDKGEVTALTDGLGWVYVKFGDFSAAARLMVDVDKYPTRGDFTNDGVVDVVDIAYLRRHLGKMAVGKADARDLNGDGKIDALDLRILTTLCTRPRCATQ